MVGSLTRSCPTCDAGMNKISAESVLVRVWDRWFRDD